MRNTAKATTLESKFPLLAVEYNCILSKDADITACFRVHLPELFTVASAEYDAIHSAWHKAIKTLPDYTIVHKQDWYIKVIKDLVASTLKKVANIDRRYENGDIEEKRLIVSSMFLDFLEFDGTRHRTPRLNSAIALIYQDNSKLQGKKNGASLSFLDLSQDVIPLGVVQSRMAQTHA